MSGLIHVDLTNSIGALQIGNLFALFLFGILTSQTFTYYNNFRGDRWEYKALHAFEVGHTVLISFEVYRSTITLYGLPQLLVKLPGLALVTTFGGAITLLVQGFFAFRLWTVLPGIYRFIGPFCIFVSWLRCGAGVFLSLEGILSITVKAFFIRWSWLIVVLLAVGAVLDVIIALSTIYYLQKQRDSGVERLATVVERLILFTIRTGLLTSVSAVFILITFITLPNNLIWVALYTVLAKLYSNSLLSAQQMREEVISWPISRPSGNTVSRPGIGTQGHVKLESQSISIEMKSPREKGQYSPRSPVIDIRAPSPKISTPAKSYRLPPLRHI
ncbi:hypothetical protein GALMADRAFT_133874 [Galerina marginata CBS 339.88]|uniref:DUF6534 domain-containing protein n=1 Tax=Galerina marginata (strain CBS 339.88) TaxID=685588 RepID=A0A067TZX1_GALM3|nr:hypothetical protein GALMADRAFT_133874 [Galerina marginata CBS 339.88]